jgi:hypothetical protein
MKSQMFVGAALIGMGVTSSAMATVIGNQVFGDSYLVVDGAKTYSVLDVYVKSNSATDVFSSVYGVASFKASWTQVQSKDFMQSTGSSWNPNSTSAAAWDSFVTTGMRTQQASEYGATPIALTADPGFSNFNTAGAKKLVGPATGNGPGWYPSAGANPATNPFCSFGNYNGQSGSINTAKADRDIAGNGVMSGQSLDNMFMIGRFSIDITGVDQDTFTMALKFGMTVVSDGVTRSGSTDAAFRVDQTLTFANATPIPAPAALSLLGAAGLISRRRKA